MTRRETVSQRVYRRRAEAYSRGGRGKITGGTILPVGENRPVSIQHNEALGCLARGLLFFGPTVADIALWYAAAHGHPEAAGPAVVGAPIALAIAFIAGNAE